MACHRRSHGIAVAVAIAERRPGFFTCTPARGFLVDSVCSVGGGVEMANALVRGP